MTFFVKTETLDGNTEQKISIFYRSLTPCNVVFLSLSLYWNRKVEKEILKERYKDKILFLIFTVPD